MDESYWMDPLAAVTTKARNAYLYDVTVREWEIASRVVSHRFTSIRTRQRGLADDPELQWLS